MKLTLKSISQDIDISDPEQGSSALVFEADVVPAGVATTLRIPVTDEAIQMLVNYLGLVQTGVEEPEEEPQEEEPEEELEDHQEEHPDVLMGATEFPPKRAPAPTYPQQRRPSPRPVQRPQVDQDEDGTPSL